MQLEFREGGTDCPFQSAAFIFWTPAFLVTEGWKRWSAAVQRKRGLRLERWETNGVFSVSLIAAVLSGYTGEA